MNRFLGISEQWLRNKDAVFRELFGYEDENSSSISTPSFSPTLGWIETLPPPMSLPDLIVEIEPRKKKPNCPHFKSIELIKSIVLEDGPIGCTASTRAISQTFEEQLPDLTSLIKEINMENQRDIVDYKVDTSVLSDDSRGEPVKRKKRILEKWRPYHKDNKKRL